MSAPNATDSPGIAVFTPPRVFFSCFVVGVALHLFLPDRLSSVVPLPWLADLAIGMVITFAGLGFMGWGHGRFRSLGTPVKTRLSAKVLVVESAYRYSRNPMYVGFLSMLAGIGIAADSLAILVLCVPYFIYLDRFVIAREEAYLGKRFGSAYESYCKGTRRWL